MNRHFMGLLAGVLLVTAMLGVQMGSFRAAAFDDTVEMHYNVHNSGENDVDHASVTLWIPGLGYYEKLDSFDIGDGETHSQFYHDSGLQHGTYLARVMVSSDHSRHSRWIWLDVE